MTYATRCYHAVNKINKKCKIEFYSVTKYNDVTKKNRFFIIDFLFMLKHLKKKLIHCDIKSNFN